MRKPARLRTCLALALALGLVGGAPAQTTYSADQVLQFFLKDKAAADSANANGVKREMCIGTAAECGSGANAIARFDLLVNFAYNSAEVTTAAAQNLDLFAAALKDQRLAGTKFAIDGHTDASGGEDYNIGLSERRAEAVIAYLAAQGVDSATLTAHGYGKSKPRVADPFSPENRRVETHLLD